VLLALLLAALGAAACGAAPGAGAGKPLVVTSTSVLADLIRQVAGDTAEVVSLVPLGRNPQQYEPAPQDAITLSRAAVFFQNGLHYEDFAAKLIENAGATSLKVVTLSDGYRTLTSTIDHGDHEHVFPNPYLYLDVRLAKRYVETVRDTLAGLDGRHADTYRTNAERYLAELDELDRWITGEVARIPEGQRRLMQDHASFPYYADRYGLLDLAASYEGTQEAQPSASQYATLIKQVEQYRIRVLFGEEGYSVKLLEQLARDTGARLVPGLHAATLGSTEETNSYVEIMRWNTRLIVDNLGGGG